ncbi:MAG: DUF1887 family CARF protein [Elusimicrobia bacterium]|nr:DUF1887 family CARF protein [Elusimicrobiota bacterium]
MKKTKTLISLVSDQQIPNFLFSKQIKPDKHILISTKKMETKNQSLNLIKALGSPEYKIVEVNQDDIQDIEKKLSNLKFGDDEELIVNITGGNKLVSHVAYEIFKAKKASIYYLPFPSNNYLKLYPKEDASKLEINQKINLGEYLKAYGVEFKFQGLFSKDIALPKKMFENFANNELNGEEIKELRGSRRKDNIAITEDIRNFLKKIDFQSKEENTLSRREICFLTGGWFEEYIYFTLQEILQLQREHIAAGKIFRSGVQNEHDAMLTYENKLYIIECKTSLKNNGQSIFSETIYKSSALLKDLGLSAKSILMTMDSTTLRNNNGEFNPDFLKRAKLFEVKVFDYKIISDCDEFKSKLKEYFEIQ